MSGRDAGLARKASELRQAFDRAFAEPPSPNPERLEDFIAVGVGDHSYAIHLADVSGLFADKAIMPLPNSAPEFLGIASFRGAVMPVYDLRALLGYAAKAPPRWLVTAAALPVALAFDVFDRHLRLPAQAVIRREGADAARRHVRQALHAPDMVRPIVDMASIFAVIKKQARDGTSKKGQ